MAPLECLDPEAVKRTLDVYCALLNAHKAHLNSMNVYPVPDGDTGTNMALTLVSVLEEIDGAEGAGEDAALWKAISHGSLMGARGNSGVILSQILRGMVEVFEPAESIDPAVVTTALRASADAAYRAVMRPVEGTILTVCREVAEQAEESHAPTLTALLEDCHERGADALARTPDMLPVLADAGVVDAGGAGYLLFIDSLLNVVADRPVPEAQVVEEGVVGHGAEGGGGTDVGDYRYEVMYFLEAPDDTIEGFKDDWATMGDSIVVVGGDGLWNCHIHTNQIGESIEAAIARGIPKNIRVTDLFEQVEHLEPFDGAADHVSLHNLEPVTTAAIAVGVGPGIRRIFESLGVHAVITGGQTMNPSTAQLLQAVEQVPGDEVVILPNNKNIIPVAEQVDAQSDKLVRVVPTRGIAEGFASLLAYDPGAGAVANAAVMAEAAEAVVAGEVTRAVRDARTEAGPVAEGDWIGLDRGGVRSIASSPEAAATALLEQIVTEDHELVTLITGAQASADATAVIEEWLSQHRPGVEVEVHQGQQPNYPFYFGVE